jgi:cyanophycinase
MARRANKPTLIAVGGHEDKAENPEILQSVADRLGRKKVIVATLASNAAKDAWEDYKKVFGGLGVEAVHLNLESRTEALDETSISILDGAGGIFFTGGDQLAITAKLGGTLLCQHMHGLFMKGNLVIAGTSAGASVLSETMLVSGDNERSHRAKALLLMAPGLGFISGVVIDQHFAERGRVSRLLGIVAQNPRTLGIGVDENTAVLIEGDTFDVIGDGAVYVVDGHPITHTNLSEQEADKTISIFGVRLHVLGRGDRFHLHERTPEPPKEDASS